MESTHGNAGTPVTQTEASWAELRDRLWRPGVALPDIYTGAQRILDGTPPKGWAGGTERVAIVGSLTVDPLARAFACALLREGTFPSIYQGPFGAYVQEILDPSSALHAFAPATVVIAPDWREIAPALAAAASNEALEAAMEATVDLFDRCWEILRRSGCRIIQHTLVSPAASYRGPADANWPAGEIRQVARLNESAIARGRGRVFWLDVDRLAQEVGLLRWAPERFYCNGKLPFDPQFLAAYMRRAGAAWRLSHARAKKVLVLDLDNTLWGGVVGDDGVDGLVLGPQTPAGEAFMRWGTYLRGLAKRGVVLAVCSKNDPETAKLAFEHPHACLSLHDFGAFVCSWQDKPSGIRGIAKALNVGLDALVFADDNPAECELVRTELPQVGVVELGTDPNAFVASLELERWFDLDAYTGEDLRRSASYAARRAVAAELAGETDLDGFLARLQMLGDFHFVRDGEFARVAQLEQKTNQFNLTGRRYDEAALRALYERDDVRVAAFGLRDRYADHGLVASLVAVREGDALRVDSWVMSCRVFSRTAEQFVMERLAEHAAASGAARIVGEYVPTDRNGVVASLYARLGFSQLDAEGRWWALDLAQRAAFPTHVAPAPQPPAERL